MSGGKSLCFEWMGDLMEEQGYEVHRPTTSEINQFWYDEADTTLPVDGGIVIRSGLLDEAKRIVNGARNDAYGTPEQDFQKIATLWNEYLKHRPDGLSGDDVAVMMILLKVARIARDPNNYDSWLDIAGYAACGWDVVLNGKS